MCGLFGIFGDLDYKDKEIFNQLMVVSSLRGVDSAGASTIRAKDYESETIKLVGTPYDLLDHPKYDNVVRVFDKVAVLGHVRKATQGGISRLVAHPFESEHIVFTHNGTLNNWRSAWKSGGVEGNYSSDSQKMADAVAAMGIKETVEETVGAYALVWADKNRQSLNMLRNSQRELWYAMTEDGSKLYYASEWRMLMLILDRCDKNLWKNEEKEGVRFHKLPVNLHVEWEFKGKRVQIREQTIIEGGTSVTTHIPFTGSYHNRQATHLESRFDPFTGEETELDDEIPTMGTPPSASQIVIPPATTQKANESSNTKNTTTASAKADKPSSDDSRRKSTPLSLVSNRSGNSTGSKASGDEIEGYNGELLDEKGFMEETNGKCTFCDTDLSFKEAKSGGIHSWVDRGRFLCNHCTGTRNAVNAVC